MELTKYILDFFFSHFWHFLGLVIILALVFRREVINFTIKRQIQNPQQLNWIERQISNLKVTSSILVWGISII